MGEQLHVEEIVTFWTWMLIMLVYIPLLLLWVFTLVDLSNRADLSGMAKGLWAVAVVLLPLIGLLIYFIARPEAPEMQPEPAERAQQIRDESLNDTTFDQLEKLAELNKSGVISDEEFTAAKGKLLGS